MLAAPALDMPLTDTYFVIAHFHYVMVGGSVMAYLGGIHFWWPKITGRLYNDLWARISAMLIFLGFVATFGPQFVLGYEGMPRRYHIYPAVFQPLNVMSSVGALVLAVGYLFPVLYLLRSLRYGKPAGPNPWGATGLEWTTPSPPPKDNFETVPVVDKQAYCYPVGGRDEQSRPRTQKAEAGE
jgi:cytochrome c oxidase subunit 1